jgi:hypothetical protein
VGRFGNYVDEVLGLLGGGGGWVCRFDAHRRAREKLVQVGGRGSRYGRLRSVLPLVSLRTAAAAAAAAAEALCFAAPSCWTR